MLKAYKPILNDIFKAHVLIEYLVNEVWSNASNKHCKTRLNDELKAIYHKHGWFRTHLMNIYKVCKRLKPSEKVDFKNAFNINNRIEDLCNGTIKPVPLSSLNKDLVEAIRPFFKDLYTKFLGWELVRQKYGEKKTYYDVLNFENEFNECPCCGYGDLKTFNSKGHSPFDHYLPQKHYPFSAINFQNLVPLCTTCNSDEKGETDVLIDGTPVFYPFANNHPEIFVIVTIEKNSIPLLIKKTGAIENKLHKSALLINFNLKDDLRVESWDRIFDIRNRYFAKIADNRISWLNEVRLMFRKENINSLDSAFEEIIEYDAYKHLGFLKSPYLKSLQAYVPLFKAITEVTGNSVMST